MPRITFEKVTRKAVRSGVCSKCGKRRQQTKTFHQTLNPWNTVNGRPKSRDEIRDELIAEAEAWAKKKVFCASCNA